MSSRWSTPVGGLPYAPTRTSWWSSPPREELSKEDEAYGQGGAWRAQHEERARRMKEIEGSKLLSLTNSELQAWVDLLHQQIADEEKNSSSSRHHIKLL
jgi:exopolyphosphatase/pppGpp-phosphohydrolase